jgi:hypothetical protein
MSTTLVCPNCAAHHAVEERFCSECGLPLIYPPDVVLPPETELRERARKVMPGYAEGPLVQVGSARNQAEAELIQGLLLEHGIPSLVRRSGGFDVPDFLAAGPRDIVVPASGADLARDILRVPAHTPFAVATRPSWVRVLALVLAIVALLVVATFVVGAAFAQTTRGGSQTGQVRAPGALGMA